MAEPITAGTLFRYLFLGDRKAIESLMQSPRALWLGAIFVLSAGFAREYDAESLLHEPWYLLIPFAASLVTSFILYGLLYGIADAKKAEGRGFFELYPTFLTLYWLTAPLAWLYAIPVERFLPPLDAAQANYALLAFVSVWRVLLIIRASAVMFSMSYPVVTSVTLWFADTVMVIALFVMPKPIFSVMGGVHLSDTEDFVIHITLLLTFLGVNAWPVLFAAMLGIYARTTAAPVFPKIPESRGLISASAKSVAAASLAVWFAVLPFTQREQHLRYTVEQELKYGDVLHGIKMMSKHEPTDFPPHWAPPPRIGYGETLPQLSTVFSLLSDKSVAPWVAEAYWERGSEDFKNFAEKWGFPEHLSNIDSYLDSMETHPARREIIHDDARELEELLIFCETYDRWLGPNNDKRKVRIRRLLGPLADEASGEERAYPPKRPPFQEQPAT